MPFVSWLTPKYVKILENTTKLLQKGVQVHQKLSKMVPRGCQGAPQMLKMELLGTLWGPRTLKMEPLGVTLEVKMGALGASGDLWGVMGVWGGPGYQKV